MIYLDNSATTRPFDSVIDTVSEMDKEAYFNISSPYSCALAAEKKFALARRTVAKALNASENEIIFTSGGTESDNTALDLAPDNSEVIVACYEHHAVLNCEANLKRRNVRMILCPVSSNGTVEPETLKSLITPNTSLVSIMHVNNEIGAINPIRELVAAVKAASDKILFHSDGVQAFMHIKTDMKELNVDLYSVSAHKVHGPKGVGALYVKKGVKFHPFIHGGGQQSNLRSGTVNVPAICGFAKAIETLSTLNFDFEALKSEYVKRLTAIPDTRLICEGSSPNVLSIAFMGVKASSLQNALENDVIIGKGSACTSRSSKVSHVLDAIKLPMNVAEATVRISFGALNTVAEAEVACEKIRSAVEYLRKYKRK